MTSSLTHKQQRYLRQLSHDKKPLIMVGNAGLSAAVIAEAEICISRHELIKVRLNAADQTSRKAMIEELCRALGAKLVFAIGHVATVYRPAVPPIIVLPWDKV